MNGSQANELGARLEQSVTDLDCHAQRWTVHHWRLVHRNQRIDVEVDEPMKLLRLTSTRLCIVPVNLHPIVTHLCEMHNQGLNGFDMILDDGDLLCRVQSDLIDPDNLTPERLGQLIGRLEQGGRDFVDRLVRRCADDLLIRIHHQLENDHHEAPNCPG